MTSSPVGSCDYNRFYYSSHTTKGWKSPEIARSTTLVSGVSKLVLLVGSEEGNGQIFAPSSDGEATGMTKTLRTGAPERSPHS